MRLAVVGPAHPYKGGLAQHATTLAHQLCAAGHDVVLESWSAQYPALLYPGRQTISQPEVPPFPATRRELSWRRPDGWWRLGRRLGREVDAIILCVSTSVQIPAFVAIDLGRRVGPARLVALCHNVLPHERRFFDRPLTTALFRRCDAIVVHSPQQADTARELTRTPVHVAEMPPHLPTHRAAAGPATGPAHPYERLLFFGIVRPYKGLDVLLRALAGGPPEIRLRVAGEFWHDLDGTRRLIADLGLADRVELRPGYVPAEEVPALFSDVDALVLPYRSATASQNTLIAFEHGVPVIATRTGTLADHVHEGVDGLLCEPGDVASLTDALKRFYAEGTPQQLRAGVSRVDPAPLWRAYVAALVAAIPAGRPGAVS